MNHRNLRHLLSLTDDLAMVRTRLANERTFLAYARTFIGAFSAGVGMVELTSDAQYVSLGRWLVRLSPLILVFGAWRLVRVMRGLNRLEAQDEARARAEDEPKGP